MHKASDLNYQKGFGENTAAMRMADILKKVKARQAGLNKEKEEPKPFPGPQDKDKVPSIPRIYQFPNAKQVAKPEESNIEKNKIKRPNVVSQEPSSVKVEKYPYDNSLRLYEETLILLRQILKENIDYTSIDVNKLNVQIEKIVEQMRAGNEHLLYLAFTKEFKGEDYLAYHSLNVCIYSLEIGIGLGYDKYKLHELALLSALHDIKMVEHKELVNQPRRLTKEERDKVKRHARDSAYAVEKMIKDHTKIAVSAILQHHEYVNGSGYPNGLHGDEINEYAKVISLVDMYEANIHPRIYRDAYLASDALQEVIRNKDKFEYRFIQVLVDRIGMFPVGSIVKLSSHEIAQVIKISYTNSMSPVVQILVNSNGRPIKEKKIIDLSKSQEVVIKKELKKEDVAASRS